ncbi:class I SAM-dependent methyltransferase [Flexivirga caeni]|nr:class I SAM-dependent methyltransferase [Flexivirga caeni]
MATDVMPGHWYKNYERGRPGYPNAVLDLVDLAPTAAVLDVAAGTGKFTQLLAARFRRVVAVEPDHEMRHMLTVACPEAVCLTGSADRLPVADDSVDAVFVAQAFHWFDNEATLAEFARVLHPGGVVLVAWNVATGEVTPDISPVLELLAPMWPDEFGFPLDMLRGDWSPTCWKLPYARATFSDIRTAHFANPQSVDPEGLVAFFGSMGWIANLPDTERLPLLKELQSKLTSDHYSLPWRTRIEWTQSIA